MKAPFFFQIFEALALRRSVYEYAARTPGAWREATAVVCIVSIVQGMALTELLRTELGNFALAALPLLVLYDVAVWMVTSTIAFLVGRAFTEEADFKRVLRCFGYAAAPMLLRVLSFLEPRIVAVTVGSWLVATSVVAIRVSLGLSLGLSVLVALILRAALVWLWYMSGIHFI